MFLSLESEDSLINLSNILQINLVGLKKQDNVYEPIESEQPIGIDFWFIDDLKLFVPYKDTEKLLEDFKSIKMLLPYKTVGIIEI